MKILSALIVLTVMISAAFGGDWVKLSSPHFELYTTAGERRGRDAILRFEQLRAFFLDVASSGETSSAPVRIVLFRGEKEFTPYRVHEGAVAHYAASRSGDMIVIQDLSSDHYPVAVHEYAHLFLQHSGLHVPLWFNEGFADLFSTLRPIGDKVRVGELMPGRMHLALAGNWIPFRELVEVGPLSAYYNERDRSSMFYSECWALVRMLFVDPSYHGKFGRLMEQVGAAPFPEVLKALYGKSLKEVEDETQKTLRSGQVSVVTFPIKMEKADEDVTVTQLPEREMDAVLAEVLISARKAEQAAAVYKRLAAETDASPAVQVRLGFLALQLAQTNAARRHFESAWAGGATDPQFCFEYSIMLSQMQAPRARVIEVLERGIAGRPADVAARLRLAAVRGAGNDFAGAIAECRKIRRTDPTHAYSLYTILAYSMARLQNWEESRRLSESARKYARSAGQRAYSEEFSHYLADRGAGKEHQLPAGPWMRLEMGLPE